MTAKEALAHLKTSPVSFLEKNLLICAGLNPKTGKIASGSQIVNDYYIHSEEKNSDTKKPSYDNAFRITPLSISKDKSQNASTECFKAHVVRMFPTTSTYGQNISYVFDWESIEVYELNGDAEVMVTGMLNGCTFVAAKIQGKTLVAHIQPGKIKSTDLKNYIEKKPLLTKSPKSLELTIFKEKKRETEYIDSLKLRNLIKEKGRFTSHPKDSVEVYGKGVEYPTNASVVGVFKDGNWEIYGQQADNAGITANIGKIKKIL